MKLAERMLSGCEIIIVHLPDGNTLLWGTGQGLLWLTLLVLEYIHL